MSAVCYLFNIEPNCWHCVLELIVFHLKKESAFASTIQTQKQDLSILSSSSALLGGGLHFFQVTDIAAH